MVNTLGRGVPDITLNAESQAFAELQPAASSDSTGNALPFAKGFDSAQKQVAQMAPECEEAVDWETIAHYLSRCQSSHSISSHSTVAQSSFPNYQPSGGQQQANTPHQDLLLRRNTVPPSMNKTPTNTDPQSTPPTPPPPSGGLSTGAKAGIAGAAAVGIVIVLASLVAFHTRRRKRKYGFRTKGKDGTGADIEGHFPVPGDKGEGVPMIFHSRKQSGGTGLGIEVIPLEGGPLSPEFGSGHTPLMNTDYSASVHSALDYQTSPTMENHRMYNSPALNSYRPQTAQTTHSYESRQRATSIEEPLDDPFEQHNQRSRPSHPFSGLSEAIPPPPLVKRVPHSMADYQSAVPLGFANGFVQVEREEDETGHEIGTTAREQAETRIEIDMDESEGEEGPDGDENLPVYEETPAAAAASRPIEKEFRPREDDDGDDTEEERSFETHLTKSDLG